MDSIHPVQKILGAVSAHDNLVWTGWGEMQLQATSEVFADFLYAPYVGDAVARHTVEQFRIYHLLQLVERVIDDVAATIEEMQISVFLLAVEKSHICGYDGAVGVAHLNQEAVLLAMCQDVALQLGVFG